MSDPSPSNILFSTRYEYFLNYGNMTGTKTIPATVLGAGLAQNMGDLTIPIDNNDNFSQIQVNFSTSSSDWYKFPVRDYSLDANFNIATVGTRTGNNVVLTFFLVNKTGGSHTSTACTVMANAYLFETPS